jgi:asparagine synthase (glutamine-hydrolysing)
MDPGSLKDVDRLAWFYDQPFGDSSALPTFALCEAASDHAVVFLSGDGGDEAFGGYRRYFHADRNRWLTSIPSLAAQALFGVLNHFPSLSSTHYRLLKSSLPDRGWAAAYDGIPQDPVLKMVLPKELKHRYLEAGKPLWNRWDATNGQSMLARQQSLDYAMYLPDDILVKVDRASMAHSIEVRSPFLDYRIVEWAAQQPRRTLINGHYGKLPLRKLARRHLPESVLRAEKRGFGVPVAEWFRQPHGHDFIKERLLSGSAKKRGLWDVKGVEQVARAHWSGKGRDFGQWLWRLSFLDAWSNYYLDGNNFL